MLAIILFILVLLAFNVLYFKRAYEEFEKLEQFNRDLLELWDKQEEFDRAVVMEYHTLMDYLNLEIYKEPELEIKGVDMRDTTVKWNLKIRKKHGKRVGKKV